MSKKPSHKAVTVREGKDGTKDYWVRIGAAWTNKDGSLSVNLDALPVNGRIILFENKEESEGNDDAK